MTNNTECGKLLEEIKCALCSPNSQSLFHSPEREAVDRDLALPLLCKDYCKEFFYTCRGHIPGKEMCESSTPLQSILPGHLFWNACIQKWKMNVIFQNTCSSLVVNLFKCVPFYCCQRGWLVSVHNLYVGSVGNVLLSCFVLNRRYSWWSSHTSCYPLDYQHISGWCLYPSNVGIKTASSSTWLTHTCRLRTDSESVSLNKTQLKIQKNAMPYRALSHILTNLLIFT